MLKDFNATPDDPEELKEANRLLVDEVKSLSLKVEQLQHQLHGHNRHRFGSKSETADQLNLTFDEDEEIAEAAAKPSKPKRRMAMSHQPASTAGNLYRIIWTGTNRFYRLALNVVCVAVR